MLNSSLNLSNRRSVDRDPGRGLPQTVVTASYLGPSGIGLGELTIRVPMDHLPGRAPRDQGQRR